ncbi:hypothetical protein IGI04_024906 [Brassica rapa subsp. trilocularis]|uniref:Uncharacterized protein n=1 Tax=Brassica rapa subsp. trilocularis TaxID=1813537 RepID=A0ABQ7M814_BRACM|nr:hypothetical protein IGI04_024906 [Brassica rapa subsp. trilocularis]
MSVTYNEPWFTNTLYCWIGPGDQIWPNQQQMKRSDFGVSMGHHITTLILIVLSYVCRYSLRQA